MKKSILIVDDEELSRELLRQMFENEYDIIMAKNGQEAISLVVENIDKIVCILLDLVMPVLNGYQVLQVLNAKKITGHIPVVLITAQADTEVELACYSLGASSVVSKPYVAQVVRQNVNNIINFHQNMNHLENKVQEQKDKLRKKQEKLERFNDTLLEAISEIVEFRDLESGQHVKRVKGFTRIITQAYMQKFPEAALTKADVDTIVRASALHDVGKIAIPDNVLLKPGRLTDEERKIMMDHTVRGCEILNQLEDVQDEEQFRAAYDICRHHHERHDGRGYPDGLKGDEIPLSAKLVSIVDVYDALVSERVYKKAFDKDTAYHMIMNGDCGIFDPKLLEVFSSCRNAMAAFADSWH